MTDTAIFDFFDFDDVEWINLDIFYDPVYFLLLIYSEIISLYKELYFCPKKAVFHSQYEATFHKDSHKMLHN